MLALYLQLLKGSATVFNATPRLLNPPPVRNKSGLGNWPLSWKGIKYVSTGLFQTCMLMREHCQQARPRGASGGLRRAQKRSCLFLDRSFTRRMLTACSARVPTCDNKQKRLLSVYHFLFLNVRVTSGCWASAKIKIHREKEDSSHSFRGGSKTPFPSPLWTLKKSITSTIISSLKAGSANFLWNKRRFKCTHVQWFS